MRTQYPALREGRLKNGILTRALVLTPHYNHPAAITRTAQTMHGLGLDVLVVDDGSCKERKLVLQTLVSDSTRVPYRPINGGKDTVVKTDLKYAEEHGYSHVLRVDISGRHHLDDTPKLLAATEQNPEVAVCGWPRYGGNAPKAWLYGRKVTDFWNMLHTWSRDIKDGMCGFHLYPLVPALSVVHEETVGDRMNFDTETLIHLYWRGVEPVWIKTPVQYAVDDVSYFNTFADSMRINRMYTRLFLEMLRRRLGILFGKDRLRR